MQQATRPLCHIVALFLKHVGVGKMRGIHCLTYNRSSDENKKKLHVLSNVLYMPWRNMCVQFSTEKCTLTWPLNTKTIHFMQIKFNIFILQYLVRYAKRNVNTFYLRVLRIQCALILWARIHEAMPYIHYTRTLWTRKKKFGKIKIIKFQRVVESFSYNSTIYTHYW